MSDPRPFDPNKGFPNPEVDPDDDVEIDPRTGAGTSLPATPAGETLPGSSTVTDPNAGAPVGLPSDQAEPGDEAALDQPPA